MLKVDGNLEIPQLIGYQGSVETTRVSLDAGTQSLLYTVSSGNGSVISVVSMDAATMTPARDCGLFVPTAFQLTPATREAIPPPTVPTPVNLAITATDANTTLTPTDLPLVALAINEFNFCPEGPPAPVRPTLSLTADPNTGTLNLSFPSETNVTYEVLIAGSLDEDFDVIASLPGTGDELSHQLLIDGDSGQGFYRVRAVSNTD